MDNRKRLCDNEAQFLGLELNYQKYLHVFGNPKNQFCNTVPQSSATAAMSAGGQGVVY